MAKDTLTIDVSPALRDAMQIRTKEGVDYFTLLGLSRDVSDEKIIDTAILERSKSLRKWQTSPAYSAECVKLLTILHRAGKIVKDPHRRGAYRQELERLERGDKIDSREEFQNLVRAALGDNALDALARRELMRFASENNIRDAQQIVAQVREEISAARAAEAARQKDEEWEFRINEEGEEGFILTLNSLEESGEFTDLSPARLMAQAGKYKVPPDRAAQLIAEFQKSRFRKMVKRVAAGGVVSDAQARLILPKAAAYGLDQHEAYDLIADYTLSARSTDDALKFLAFAQAFSDDDISTIVENKTVTRRRRGFLSLDTLFPDWLRNLLLIGGAGAALVFLLLYLKDNYKKPAAPKPAVALSVTPPAETAAGTPTPAPPAGAGASSAAPAAPTASPTPTLEEKPDPPSGMLAFQPEKPGDPPAFEMGITEVTCAQFEEYLKAMLEPPPPGFSAQGADAAKPVANITWDKAMAYCKWLAKNQNFEPGSVTLPSQAEFLRALRGRTTRSNPMVQDFWSRCKLGTGGPAQPVRQNPLDRIFLGTGQMYDLIGNVAEWGRETRDTQRALLGGDTRQTAADFNPLAQRWVAATTASPTIGFRIVHQLGK